MSTAAKTSRAQVWLDSLGDWSWPGRAAEAVEVRPPSWVPAFPPRLEPDRRSGRSRAGPPQRPGVVAARACALLALGALGALCATLAVSGRQDAERLLGLTRDGERPASDRPDRRHAIPAAAYPRRREH